MLSNQRIFYYWKTKSDELGYDVFLSVLDGMLYTHDDLQLFEDMEIEHREEMSKVPSFAQLMADYPTAKTYVKQHTKDLMDSLKIKIEQGIMRDRDTTQMEAELKKLSFQYAYLTENEKITKAGLTREEIELAKETPIRNFIKLDHNGKAKCIFHTDRTASMHVYNTNRFYCFGCNKSGSVADIVMQLYSLDFLTAIKKILGK